LGQRDAISKQNATTMHIKGTDMRHQSMSAKAPNFLKQLTNYHKIPKHRENERCT